MSPIAKSIEKGEIRQLYNESSYPSMIKKGLLSRKLSRNSHLSKPKTGEKQLPYCTHSQILRYYDKNGELCLVLHQYLKPNGMIGGSGKPDPKRLLLGNTAYYVENKTPT